MKLVALYEMLRGRISQNSMSQTQYLKVLEKELNRINRVIDLKIVNGQSYSKEARDHKLILRKVRYINNSRKSIFQKLFTFQSFQF